MILVLQTRNLSVTAMSDLSLEDCSVRDLSNKFVSLSKAVEGSTFGKADP